MASVIGRIALDNSLAHKACALLIGIGIWGVVSSVHDETITINTPLYFYNVPTSTKISAPSHLQLTLSGSRKDLGAINYQTLAAHIDAQKMLLQGGMVVKSEALFLPNTVKVVHYTPMNVTLAQTQAS